MDPDTSRLHLQVLTKLCTVQKEFHFWIKTATWSHRIMLNNLSLILCRVCWLINTSAKHSELWKLGWWRINASSDESQWKTDFLLSYILCISAESNECARGNFIMAEISSGIIARCILFDLWIWIHFGRRGALAVIVWWVKHSVFCLTYGSVICLEH